MPKMQSSNSNSELYAYVRKFQAEICKWLIGIDYVQGYYIGKPSQYLDTTVESTAVDSNEPYKLMIYVSQAKTTITSHLQISARNFLTSV